MIILAGFALVVVSVLIAGGDLTRVTSIRLRGVVMIVVAFVAQTLLVEVFASTFGSSFAQTMHLLTYAVGALFLLMNRHIRGILVIGLGAALNTVAIVANGGVMPASAWASRTAGIIPATGATFDNSRFVSHARLQFLGDVFAIPHGWPLANVFSAGDVVLLVGAFITLHAAAGSRLFPHAPGTERPTLASVEYAGADGSQMHRDAVQH